MSPMSAAAAAAALVAVVFSKRWHAVGGDGSGSDSQPGKRH